MPVFVRFHKIIERLTDLLTVPMIDAMSNISAVLLTGVGANESIAAVAVRSCWAITTSELDLQAWKPWCHVYSPLPPQFPNQEPPRAQQLFVLDFLTMPHLRHTGMIVLCVSDRVEKWLKIRTLRLHHF